MVREVLKEWLKKWKENYLKKGPIARFIFIMAITVVLNFGMFKTIKIPSEELNKIYNIEDDVTYLEIPKSFSVNREDLNAGNLEGVIWKLIYLRSKTDVVCFENRGSFLKYEGKVIYDAVTTKVSYNKGEFFEVKDKECRPLPLEENKFTFNWRFEVTMPLYDIIKESKEGVIPLNETEYTMKLGEVTIHPDVRTYIKPGWKTEITKFIFLFFSAGTLLWAWSRTFYLIKYGWDKR